MRERMVSGAEGLLTYGRQGGSHSRGASTGWARYPQTANVCHDATLWPADARRMRAIARAVIARWKRAATAAIAAIDGRRS